MGIHGLALRWLPLGLAMALLVFAALLTSCGGEREAAATAPTPALPASTVHSAPPPAPASIPAPISADPRAAVPPPASTVAQTRRPAPAPVATVAPTPTLTAVPAPTATPPPTPTVVLPTPTLPPTSTPTAPSPIAGIERAAQLERNKPDLADQIKALPWVADGIDNSERDAVQLLVDSANHYPETFRALLQMPWVSDYEVAVAETGAIHAIRWAAKSAPAVSEQMLQISWVQDDITEAEGEVIARLRLIARHDEEFALAMLGMPFLQTLEFDDLLAVLAIHRLSRYADDGRLKALKEHPTLEDGITDDLATLVAAVGTIREADEVERMLNPGYANIEVYTGKTELTPELKISIVRIHSESRPETMPELVRIAELLESTMQVPLPKPHMIFVISDWAVSVSDRGISQGRRYDFAYGLRGDREDTQRFASQYATDRPMLPSVMIHEIGHDYFGNELKSWLNHTPVKTFEYVYRLDGRDPAEVPEAVLNTIHQRSGCEARNIQHLEEMNPPSSDRTNSLCHHYLGYWMGRELLEAVGQEEYFARMRRFYHIKEELVAAGVVPGIADIRDLFPEHLEIVERYWSGDVGNPEEKYWGGLANLIGHPMGHTVGCCCAGCAPADA